MIKTAAEKKEYQANYWATNKETLQKKATIYREAVKEQNKDKRKEQKHAHYIKNKASYKASATAYYERNKDTINAGRAQVRQIKQIEKAYAYLAIQSVPEKRFHSRENYRSHYAATGIMDRSLILTVED